MIPGMTWKIETQCFLLLDICRQLNVIFELFNCLTPPQIGYNLCILWFVCLVCFPDSQIVQTIFSGSHSGRVAISCSGCYQSFTRRETRSNGRKIPFIGLCWPEWTGSLGLKISLSAHPSNWKNMFIVSTYMALLLHSSACFNRAETENWSLHRKTAVEHLYSSNPRDFQVPTDKGFTNTRFYG